MKHIKILLDKKTPKANKHKRQTQAIKSKLKAQIRAVEVNSIKVHKKCIKEACPTCVVKFWSHSSKRSFSSRRCDQDKFSLYSMHQT